MVAYRIETPRLQLLAPDPLRAIELLRAAQASREALAPYMPWSHALPDDEGMIEQLRKWRALFDGDADRHYLITEKDSGEVIGACGSHPRVRGRAREVGYWIRTDRSGRGLATEAAGALVHAEFAAFEHERIQLFVDPANGTSARVAEKMGFSRIGLIPGACPWNEEPSRDGVPYSVERDDFAQPPGVVLWDVVGRRWPVTSS